MSARTGDMHGVLCRDVVAADWPSLGRRVVAALELGWEGELADRLAGELGVGGAGCGVDFDRDRRRGADEDAGDAREVSGATREGVGRGVPVGVRDGVRW